MCRWAAYTGDPIFLEDVVASPGQSLIAQSIHARESKCGTNGDGFGLAWYGERPEPGLYRDVLPAWSDQNLRSLARQTRSRLFLAHVRASTGTATSRSNCHPFAVGRWSFMHNGQVGGYAGFRREVDMMIGAAEYPHRLGTTDSEAMFLLALGYGLEVRPRAALERAVGALEAMSRAQGSTPHMRISLAVSDGAALHVVRYASDEHAPSLYHRQMPASNGRLVVSEPLDDEAGCWQAIPTASFATITPDGVAIEPFRPRLPRARRAA